MTKSYTTPNPYTTKPDLEAERIFRAGLPERVRRQSSTPMRNWAWKPERKKRRKIPLTLKPGPEKVAIILGLAAQNFSAATISSVVGENVAHVERVLEAA